jgi:hypothetical protein
MTFDTSEVDRSLHASRFNRDHSDRTPGNGITSQAPTCFRVDLDLVGSRGFVGLTSLGSALVASPFINLI